MASVLKFMKTIRNNWKKSVFFTGVAIYGVHWGKNKYQESLLRTAYCLEAQKYGDAPLTLGDRPKRLTVFLNPAAKNGKSLKLFEKNVAPIFHLAGFEVTVVKTEYEGQAKKYMDVIDKTDAIVVAGGDGTVLEVVTGLLRRDDSDKWKDCAIGIVPLGHTNTLAQSLFYKGESDVRWLLESAFSVILNQTRSADVMAIKGSEDRTVYALSGLQWGPYRDAEAKKKKYWYFGGLKHRWAYIRESMKSWPPHLVAALTYQHPCDGCSRCYSPPPQPVWRWWHFLLPPKRPVVKVDYSKIDNPDCGVQYKRQVETSEFACSTVNQLSIPEQKRLDLHIGPSELSRLDYIKNGFQRIKGERSDEKSQYIVAQAFTLLPEIPQGQESWFTIDNEEFEAMPVEVNLLKEKLKLFCGQSSPIIAVDSVL